MPPTAVVLFHIFAGVIALCAGTAAMIFRKGARNHRLAGTIFTIAMLSMSATGALRAVVRDQPLNIVAGSFTFYLVATAWIAGRRRDAQPHPLDKPALLLGAAVVAVAFAFAVEAALQPGGRKGGVPPIGYLIFGSIAFSLAISDVRMTIRGGVAGPQRVRRHLWRMCLAFFVAAASFFPGQAQLFPEALRRTNVLYLPLLLLAGATIYWLIRVPRVRVPNQPTPSTATAATTAATHDETTHRHSKENQMTTLDTIARSRSNIAPTTLLALLFCFLFCLAAPPSLRAADAPQAASATPSPDPLSAHNRQIYRGLKAILLRSAGQMPAEKYAFKPVESVRTYGQIVGHIADSQYFFCSAVRGVENPRPKVEQTKTSKAELIAALQESFAFCDAAYDGLTDATAAEMVEFWGSDTPRLGVLVVNNTHSTEHYGNLVTYLRMNDLVPPTSDPDFMKQLSKP